MSTTTSQRTPRLSRPSTDGLRSTTPEELNSLLHLSARIGHEPLLVQASTGNTSVKLGRTLWIKASGKWLANADWEETLVPVDLSTCKERFEEGQDTPACDGNSGPTQLRPSVETLMHSILPQRVVIHVHSVNTIAWAVRSDAYAPLAERFSGLRWAWVPYAASGLPLARAVQRAHLQCAAADVFVLANHGLVVCGEDCETAEQLLLEVERRLAAPPRASASPRFRHLECVEKLSRWRLPVADALHTLGTDAVSRRIAKAGVLYPCQAIFFGRTLPVASCSTPLSEIAHTERTSKSPPFLVVEGSGVLVHDGITEAEQAMLLGFVEILRRIPASSAIRYLSDAEIHNALLAAGPSYTSGMRMSVSV